MIKIYISIKISKSKQKLVEGNVRIYIAMTIHWGLQVLDRGLMKCEFNIYTGCNG